MMLGVPLPDPNEPIPEEAEFHLSGLMAQAAQKVLQTNQAAAAQQQAQQQAQDPLIQIEQAKVQNQAREVDIRQQELTLRAKMHQDDLMLKKEGQDTKAGLDKAKIVSDHRSKAQDRVVKLLTAKEKKRDTPPKGKT
jgi:hypothetical protein